MSSIIKLHTVYDESRKDLLGEKQLFTFHGGEPHVQLDPKTIRDQYLWVDARLGDAEGFMQMLALIDAVSACYPKRLGLFLPYFPGARQDRRQPEGTPFTVGIYADILRRLRIDSLVTFDPHSDVVASCMNNARFEFTIIPAYSAMAELGSNSPGLEGSIAPGKYDGWICPDAGAAKKIHEAATVFKQKTIVYARKKRDPETGKLSGFHVDPLPKDGNYLLVDDICDGGGTFIGLAAAIRNQNKGDRSCPGKDFNLDLWVSHGIFSKGIGVLCCGAFRHIYRTDSYPSAGAQTGDSHVVNLYPFAANVMRRSLAK